MTYLELLCKFIDELFRLLLFLQKTLLFSFEEFLVASLSVFQSTFTKRELS